MYWSWEKSGMKKVAFAVIKVFFQLFADTRNIWLPSPHPFPKIIIQFNGIHLFIKNEYNKWIRRVVSIVESNWHTPTHTHIAHIQMRIGVFSSFSFPFSTKTKSIHITTVFRQITIPISNIIIMCKWIFIWWIQFSAFVRHFNLFSGNY